MRTIAACALLAALAFGLLPSQKAAKPARDEGLVLLVETQTESQREKKGETAQEKTAEETADAQTIRLQTEAGVISLSLEDYLTGVLLSEMPSDFQFEARKAQAVAARTFACRKLQRPKHDLADVCADFSCCQAWTSREALKKTYGDAFSSVWQEAQRAVRETAGEVLHYNDQLIDAVYFSCSGGQTEAAVAVWGSDVPYLQSVESPGEEFAPRFSSQVIISPEEFAEKLTLADKAVSLPENPAQWLGGTDTNDAGSVTRCTIGGVCFTGVQLRTIFGLNSTKFTLSFQDGSFVFDVRGFGHRVGMSQYGAEHMASFGFSYRTILQYYYQGAEVKQISQEKTAPDNPEQSG